MPENKNTKFYKQIYKQRFLKLKHFKPETISVRNRRK